MKVLEAGHIYELDYLDKSGPEDFGILTFVNREDRGHKHTGTQSQEVIRALIDRTKYLENQLHWDGNPLIIHHLRMALALYEARALLRKVEKGKIAPELVEVSPFDGHFVLTRAADQ